MIQRSSTFSVASCICVLWQLLFSSISFAQQDSTIVFTPSPTRLDQGEPQPRTLEGIVSASIGPFRGFHAGEFGTTLQPGFGFEFLANPGGWLHLLVGGKVGISDPLTTGVHLGIRQPFYRETDGSAMIFGDAALLFFDDADRLGPIGFGFRGVIGGRTEWFSTFEYRLAGEYRGKAGLTAEGVTDDRALWWIGAEVALAFELGNAVTQMTRKDSVRAAILHITKSEEIEDFDRLRSTEALEEWLDRFWARRDLTPNTPLNEARLNYEARVRLANQRYSRPRKLGISTEVGRVLAIYGEPDQTESAYSTFDANNRYELWVYSGRIKNVSPALFLFAIRAPRDWEQVYSNVLGEMTGQVPSDLPQRLRSWF